MLEWNSDEGLFDPCERRLYTAVLGNICDQMGRRTQFLGPEIRPLQTSAIPVLVGRAMPMLEADMFSEAGGASTEDLASPFGRMLDALDDLQDR